MRIHRREVRDEIAEVCDECKGELRHQKKVVQDQFLEMKDDLRHELTIDLNEQTQGALGKVYELEFKVLHLTSRTEVLEKISADKDCAIDGLESSVKSIRGSCETLSRTVAEHDRISKLQSHQQSVEIISTKHDLVRVESNLRSVKNDVQHLISGSNDFKSSTMSASIDVPEPSLVTEVKERYKGNEAALNKHTVTFEKQQLEFEEMRRRLANIEQSREPLIEVPVQKRHDDEEPDDVHKPIDGETFVKTRLTQNVPVNFTPNPHGRRSHSVRYSTPRESVQGKTRSETARVNTVSTYPRYSSQVSHHSRQHRSPDSSGDSDSDWFYYAI